MPTISALDRLKAQLLTSGIQEKNQPLFQVINQLIDYLRQSITELEKAIAGGVGSGGGGGGPTTITNQLIQQFSIGEASEEGLTIPGPPGTPGARGIDGNSGPPGYGIDGEDGDFYLPMPGPQGNPGPTGVGGPIGPSVVPNDGEDGDPAFVLLQYQQLATSVSVHAAQVILNDAQIKSLSTIPVQIVGAPAANQQYHVIAVFIIKDTNGGAYSSAATVTIRYTGNVTDLNVASNVFLSSSNKRWQVPDITSSGSTILGAGLGLVVRSSTDVTGGHPSNYMAVQVVYAIVTDGP